MDALLKLLIIALTIGIVGFIGALFITALLEGGRDGIEYYEPESAQAEAERVQELLDHDIRMRQREEWLADDDLHGDFGGDDRY